MSGWRTVALDQAVRLEQAKAHGAALRLTPAQCDELIDAWTDWYRTTGQAVDYRAIRDQMTDRALGEHWQPPSPEMTHLAARLASTSSLSMLQAVGILEAVKKA